MECVDEADSDDVAEGAEWEASGSVGGSAVVGGSGCAVGVGVAD